jgi:tRNA A37 methylthiotransferase MiaB
MKELEAMAEKTALKDEADVMSYYRLREQLENLASDFQSWSVAKICVQNCCSLFCSFPFPPTQGDQMSTPSHFLLKLKPRFFCGKK